MPQRSPRGAIRAGFQTGLLAYSEDDESVWPYFRAFLSRRRRVEIGRGHKDVVVSSVESQCSGADFRRNISNQPELVRRIFVNYRQGSLTARDENELGLGIKVGGIDVSPDRSRGDYFTSIRVYDYHRSVFAS
jgi:hypothetical protein